MRPLLLAILVAGCSSVLAQPLPTPSKARVYYALDNTAVGASRVVNPRIVKRMVDSLVCSVTGRATVAEAWRVLVAPGDIVGIKVAASGKAVSGTNPEVVDAIAAGLNEAGIPVKNIIVWDRNLEDLLAAGYRTDGKNYVLQGIDPRTDYDPESQVSAPVVGKLIWGDSQFNRRGEGRFIDTLTSGDQLSSRSFYAKVLSKKVTRVINVPSLTDSFTTGINGGIVNMTLTNLDNWRRFAKASSGGDAYIAEVYADPMIKDKVVLTILDGLILQFAGGPFPGPNFTVDNFTLFASRDVVAIDATAARLIDEQRKMNKLPSVRTQTAWLDAAAQLGLGQSAESRIDMLRVGVEGLR